MCSVLVKLHNFLQSVMRPDVAILIFLGGWEVCSCATDVVNTQETPPNF